MSACGGSRRPVGFWEGARHLDVDAVILGDLVVLVGKKGVVAALDTAILLAALDPAEVGELRVHGAADELSNVGEIDSGVGKMGAKEPQELAPPRSSS